MLFYMSPSKTMTLESLGTLELGPYVTPKTKSQKIKRLLLGYSVSELQSFYKVSKKVAEQAYDLHRITQTGASIDLFEGLVFKYLDYASLEEMAKTYLNDKLFIGSALYGVVSPLQQIAPYRLDLDNPLFIEGESLTQHWKKSVTSALIKHPSEWIIDLASEEYSRLIDLSHLSKQKSLIKIAFRDIQQGKLRTISTRAKMARGLFIRAAAIHGAHTPDALKSITVMDYAYDKAHSDATHFVYTKYDING